jgi:polyisoprenoid-binding protein YceI
MSLFVIALDVDQAFFLTQVKIPSAYWSYLCSTNKDKEIFKQVNTTIMANWNLDANHSEVSFKVKHLMINNVKGQFKSFNVSLQSESDDFKSSNISFTADVASIDTSNEQRDQHLKSADFFDAEKYPQIKFKSTQYNGKELVGDLTIRDVTKSVKLEVDFGGIAKDPWGNTKAGFTITGKINRKDWGLNWNAALETGGVLVSEEVSITAEIQLVKQA